MNKSIITLIFAVIFSAVVVPVSAASIPVSESRTVKEGKSLSSPAGNDRRIKRKLKKKVRQVGRVFKVVKTDKKDQKKARKVQKKIRRVINAW